MSILCFLPYRAMAQVVSHRLSSWRPGFDPGPVRVRFMIYKVALGQVFLRVLRFSPVIIPPVFRTHHLNVILIRRTIGRSLGTFKQTVLSRISENIGQKTSFRLLFSNLQTAECPFIEDDSFIAPFSFFKGLMFANSVWQISWVTSQDAKLFVI